MFIATAFAYPLALAVLCIGAGLLVNRVSGGFLPALLLPSVGAAALIAVSQVETYFSFAAPGTPYVIALLALAGLVLERRRLRALVSLSADELWPALVPVLVYVLALAPVIAAGRPSFSSYLVLGDSAVHMLGAYFLIHHGQDYSHLNLATSYGQYVSNYWGNAYPSGADTLFGSSAALLHLPLIWAFQPFNAFMLALAACPAWALVRRAGLGRSVAPIATLSVTLPALVYGYELIGSIKEISSLGMVLALGVLVVLHERWLGGSARQAVPFALVLAAGVSALGIGFGVWGVGEAVVLGPILIMGARSRPAAGRALALLGAGAVVTAVAALPTVAHLSDSLNVANNISSTVNPGNLARPLRAIQMFGAWLRGSYKALPTGASLTPTYILIAIAAGAALPGIVRVIRSGAWALAAWIAAMLLVWVAVTENSTTWVSAKTLMLTSPIAVLLAWAGVAALIRARRRWLFRPLAGVLALVLFGGVAASDALQYHEADLAPTARFDELALIDSRFAGRGPALFTDFDEYSLYLLRDIEVAGPDFIYPPPALAGHVRYRYPVALARLPPRLLLAYPLIITRRSPTEPRPPSAYAPLWQGTYYEVWGRQAHAPAAIAAEPASGSGVAECRRIHALAHLAAGRGGHLVAAGAGEVVEADIDHSTRPRAWGRMRQGVQLVGAGTLSVPVFLPTAGLWEVWLQGQIMPTVTVALDGHVLGSVGAQLGGNSVVPNTLTPIPVSVTRGSYTLSISRGGIDLAPGNGGSVALFHVLLTPARSGAGVRQSLPPARWRELCGRPHQWIEAVLGSIGSPT
jgi:hypothetical protein